jgi:hypothetical protein
VTVGGVRCRLQILDPATAFELEPELVKILGDTLSFAAAAPDELLGAVWHHAAGGHGVDIQELARDPVRGPEMAVAAIRSLGSLLAACVARAPVSAPWVRRMFSTLVLERFKVRISRAARYGVHADRLVEEVEDWNEIGFRPVVKWQVMAAQIRQTFGPLWTRSPYTTSTRHKSYGVPVPQSSPAVLWADNLAVLGSASSANEILNEWTPIRMIEIVESSAYRAANEQKALDEAKAENQRGR